MCSLAGEAEKATACSPAEVSVLCSGLGGTDCPEITTSHLIADVTTLDCLAVASMVTKETNNSKMFCCFISHMVQTAVS